MPSVNVAVDSLVVDALIGSELVKSKSDAKRLIESGAVSINGENVDTIDGTLSSEQFPGGIALLRRGKQTALLSLG